MPDTTFTFTSPDEVEIFVHKWDSPGGMPKGAVQIAHGAAEHSLRDARHEILNETNRDEFQRDVLAWLNKWC